ncbi:MAG: MBL fold metallo-hydrolase [Oligoflexales bacterium]
MKIQNFFDEKTFTLSYIVYDEDNKDAIVIDPVLDFDPPSGKTSLESFDKLISFLKTKNLNLRMILETHAHADHLSSSQNIKEIYPNAVLGVSEHITKVQKVFKNVFNLGNDFRTDGSQFDRLLKDGETIQAGGLEFMVIQTPGHTPACVSFYFEGVVFTGDALFMPDFGTGRCDFPDGSSKALYHSIRKLYELPDSTEVYVGHDYFPNGRKLAFKSSIKEEKTSNCHLTAETKEIDFVQMRESRDKQLSAPKLLLPSIQININAGHLPDAENNGIRYLKLPIK